MVVFLIGGVDMLVVIFFLNLYFGFVVCVVGFVINNIVLIVVGFLVGVSGLILMSIMCCVMNCLLVNVFFSGFGVVKMVMKVEGEVKLILFDDVYFIFEVVLLVMFVFGYGMVVV